jgi:hypothetical protein
MATKLFSALIWAYMAIVGGNEFRFQRVMYILKRRMVDMCVLNNVLALAPGRQTLRKLARSIVEYYFAGSYIRFSK